MAKKVETCHTPLGRLRYPSVLTPAKSNFDDKMGDPMYSSGLLFPKVEDMDEKQKAAWDKLQAFVKAAYVRFFGADKAKWPKFKFKTIRPQADKLVNNRGEAQEEFVDGAHFIECSSKFKPLVCDAHRNLVTDGTKVYGGAWARFDVNAYKYDFKGNIGIKLGLVSVQLAGYGDQFAGGRRKPEEVFEALDGAEEDLDDLSDGGDEDVM